MHHAWDLLLAVNLTQNYQSMWMLQFWLNNLDKQFFFLLSNSLLFCGLIFYCSTWVKFQINFTIFLVCVSRRSSTDTLTSVSCGFSLNTHLDEIFRPVFHHMNDLYGEGGKRVNDGPLKNSCIFLKHFCLFLSLAFFPLQVNSLCITL